VTEPLPEPEVVTLKEYIASPNDAVTERAAETLTWQSPVPEQAPPQPAKTDPLAGVAVRLTTVPDV
jgi:hypothetical protein